MRNSLAYRLSLGLTIVLTLLAFPFLLSWLINLIKESDQLTLGLIIPWKSLGLLAFAAINCTFRSRWILLRSRV